MSGKGTIVQRLATGQLTDLERRGYSEEGLQITVDKDELLEPKKVSFALTSEEKTAIYQDIKYRVIQGMTPDAIGKAVVACMDEILKEKENAAYGNENPKLNGDPKKGGFRRVE